MADLETQFNAIDKLLGLTPFFKCPHCGRRDEDKDGHKEGTFFHLYLEVSFKVTEVDDARKCFDIRLPDLDMPLDNRECLSLMCDSCGQQFPMPEEWTWEVI